MTSLWSTTKSAVNNGYGMSGFARIGLPDPFYKPRPWGIPGIHPELLEKPPYVQNEEKQRRVTRGGSSLIKGSREAKARMAYLRSLRGRGRRCRKTSSKRMLRGGDMSWLSTLLESLGGTAMNAIKRLATETGASITELLADPKALIQKLMVIAPAAARAVKNFFSGSKKQKDKPLPSSKTGQYSAYLRLLKKHDPELYEKKRMEATARRQKMERLLAMKRYGMDDDDNDDDVYDDFDKPNDKKQKQRLLAMKQYGIDNDVYDDFDKPNDKPNTKRKYHSF